MSRILKISAMLLILFALIGGMIAVAQNAKQPPTELYVRTVPAGAEVLIDGQRVGKSNDLFKVKPGERKVEVKLDGYKPAVKEAIVAATRIERVEFELEKLAGDGSAVVARESEENGRNYSIVNAIKKVHTELNALDRAYKKQDWTLVDEHANEISDTIRDEILIGFNVQQINSQLNRVKPGEDRQPFERALLNAQRIQNEIKLLTKYRRNRDIFQIWLQRVMDYGDDLHDCIRDGNIDQVPARYEALRKAWGNMHADRKFGSTFLSTIGVQPLGSKESPNQGVKPAATNILNNPGAELGNKAPEGWKQGAAIPGVTYSWDKEDSCEGKASLCIEKTVNRYFPIASWTQTIERTGNAPAVELSAQVKAEKMAKAVLDVLFLDKNDKWISHEWAAYIGSKEKDQPPVTHNWKRYAGKVDVPPKTVKIVVGLQVYGPGKVWFDDVRLVGVKENNEVFASEVDSKAARDVMTALVENFFHHNFRDVTSRKTIEWGEVKKHPNGNRSIRYTYLATFHQNPEKVVVVQVFTFDKDGKFVDYENIEGPEGEDKAKGSASADDAKVLQREVGKKLADFPEPVDLSTPESAWAAYQRASGRKDAKAVAELSWVKIDPAREEQFWKNAEPEGLAIYIKALRDSECVEVLSYHDDLAAVISRLPFPPGKGREPYSIRSFGLIDGKWKNRGEDRYPTLEAARASFEKKKDVIYKHFQKYKDGIKSNAGTSPRPIRTQPKISATKVDPNLSEIRATFDRDMRTDSFSFCGGGPYFPKTTGKPKWLDKRTCVLPVKLEKGKAYRLALNWERFQGFRSADGQPAMPTAVYFCTRGASPETVAMMTPPKVAKLSIADGAKDVPPDRTKLSVTFDRPMGGGMSWCNGPDTPKFEAVKGSAWSDDKKTCSIYALLEPGKSYTVYLNSESFGNFMNELGVSLEPVAWKFTTKK